MDCQISEPISEPIQVKSTYTSANMLKLVIEALTETKLPCPDLDLARGEGGRCGFFFEGVPGFYKMRPV